MPWPGSHMTWSCVFDPRSSRAAAPSVRAGEGGGLSRDRPSPSGGPQWALTRGTRLRCQAPRMCRDDDRGRPNAREESRQEIVEHAGMLRYEWVTARVRCTASPLGGCLGDTCKGTFHAETCSSRARSSQERRERTRLMLSTGGRPEVGHPRYIRTNYGSARVPVTWVREGGQRSVGRLRSEPGWVLQLDCASLWGRHGGGACGYLTALLVLLRLLYYRGAMGGGCCIEAMFAGCLSSETSWLLTHGWYSIACYIIVVQPDFVLRNSFPEVSLSKCFIVKGWKSSCYRKSTGTLTQQFLSMKCLSMQCGCIIVW